MDTCQPYDTMYGHQRWPSSTYLLLQSYKDCHRQVKHLRDMCTRFTIRQCYVLDAEPPPLQAVHYGWSLDVGSMLLLPITITADISPLPFGILKMVRCGFSSERPYRSARWSCAFAKFSCSIFYAMLVIKHIAVVIKDLILVLILSMVKRKLKTIGVD